MIDRIPPQDIDAEQAVLSALMINNAAFDDLDDLQPEHFYRASHKKIYSTMLKLRKKKEPVDLVTVASELKSQDDLEVVGGAMYLSNIADSAPIATNAAAYANKIIALSRAREMIAVASEIIEKGMSVVDVDEYISDAQAKILQVQTTSSLDQIFNMESLMHDAVTRIEQSQKAGDGVGYNIGMPKLDNLIHISGSKLILIAARPGMGKTALALSIAKYLAHQDIKVGFLSIEMDKESLADRLLSIESNVNALCFYAKDSLSSTAYQQIFNAAQNLSVLPIYVDDADCTIHDVERKCRKFKKMGCQVIIIDQLSKIRGKANQSKFETYTDNCSAIALLKKELRLPIFLLCQLNRNVEQRQDKKPELSDLKQTGMLEEDADMVFLIYRPGYYDESIDASRTEIILAKNRQGALGVEQQVLFKQKRGMFELL